MSQLHLNKQGIVRDGSRAKRSKWRNFISGRESDSRFCIRNSDFYSRFIVATAQYRSVSETFAYDRRTENDTLALSHSGGSTND